MKISKGFNWIMIKANGGSLRRITNFRFCVMKSLEPLNIIVCSREDKEPCSQAYIYVRGLSLDPRRDVHRLTACPSSLFILRQQRLKGS